MKESVINYLLKTTEMLLHCISEPVFYGDLVNKFKIIVGNPNFSDQFKKRLLNVIKEWHTA